MNLIKGRCLEFEKDRLIYIDETYSTMIVKEHIIIELPNNCELRTIDRQEGKYKIVVTE